MIDRQFVDVALFEHRFWLEIMGDHGRFIYSNLYPKEVKAQNNALFFINSYDALLNEARKELTIEELSILTKNASELTKQLKSFKLELLKRKLLGEIILNLNDTLLNHMLNELQEYEKVLVYLLKNQVPRIQNPISYHLMWTLDSMGHASIIIGKLDNVESALIAESIKFKQQYNDLYIKSVEFAGYMRTGLRNFPALNKLNRDAIFETKVFMDFLNDLRAFALKKELLGTLTPLILDHYYREECYYLVNLAFATGTTLPDCDPTKPRVE